MVATVRKTSVVPLPAAIVALSKAQVVPRGQPKKVSATGLGNGPPEGVTVMSYFAEFPATITPGPELDSEKVKALCTTSVNSALSLATPEVPLTSIVEYVPTGVVPSVVRVSVTLVAPLSLGTVAGLKEQLLFVGRLVHKKLTGFGKVPADGATFSV